VIQKVQRILYVYRGSVASEKGPIEIAFSDGYAVLLDAGPHGEALAVKSHAWIDYFAEPLSAEERQFIDRSGKCRLVILCKRTVGSAMRGHSA